MTASECVSYIDAIEPNAYTSAQKLRWVSECEGKVYTDLFLVQPYEFTPVTDGSRILALPAPYDRIYPRYLQAMIHYANGEYDRYANSMAVFNEAWGELNRWFGGDYDVTDRLRNKRFTDSVPAPSSPLNPFETIIEVPEGCAVAAARLVVDTPYTATYNYTAKEALPSGTYCMEQSAGVWRHFELYAMSPGGTLTWNGDNLTCRTASGSSPLAIATISGKDGTELHAGVTCRMWFGSRDNVVAEALINTAQTIPIPMVSADQDGTALGYKLYLNEYDRDHPGAMHITGRLLIPDERWSCEDRYARRRDARWRG